MNADPYHKVLTRRRDLKLIVTSATMNADKVRWSSPLQVSWGHYGND